MFRNDIIWFGLIGVSLFMPVCWASGANGSWPAAGAAVLYLDYPCAVAVVYYIPDQLLYSTAQYDQGTGTTEARPSLIVLPSVSRPLYHFDFGSC